MAAVDILSWFGTEFQPVMLDLGKIMNAEEYIMQCQLESV